MAKLTTHATNEYKVKLKIHRKQSLAIENSGQRDGNIWPICERSRALLCLVRQIRRIMNWTCQKSITTTLKDNFNILHKSRFKWEFFFPKRGKTHHIRTHQGESKKGCAQSKNPSNWYLLPNPDRDWISKLLLYMQILYSLSHRRICFTCRSLKMHYYKSINITKTKET